MIKIESLSKQFSNRKILDKVSLSFEKGKIYALIGESGSGKTTLLNIIAKLEEYTSGRVVYDDVDLKKIKANTYYRDYLGYLFQNFGLMESYTVRDNLELGFVGQKLSKKEKEEKQKEALRKVNLPHISLNQKIFELSGGESQRVALAKVFLKNPPIILADEPTASLDLLNSEEVMEILLSLKNDERTIIVATHNPLIWEKADVIIKMSDL